MKIENMNRRRNLDEISFVRPLLILLLVLFHAFAPWTGSWRPFNGFEENKLYWWIGQLAFSFMLPMFTFMSGYVWAFQREVLERKDNLLNLCEKKLKRLYVPSIVFSVLYIICNPPNGISFIWSFDYALLILNGVGHMWFLPMLFWCFILCQLLFFIPKRFVRIIIVVLLAVFNVISLPFQLKQSCFYLIFFYFGYEFYLVSEKVKQYATKRVICCIWVLFLILFVVLLEIKEYLQMYFTEIHGYYKLFGIGVIKLCRIIYSILGIVAMYLTAASYTNKRQLPNLIIKIGGLCFGVYLYQQFILQFLYYRIDIQTIVGNELLPWVGFIVTLLCSLSLSYITRLTKIGRFLI